MCDALRAACKAVYHSANFYHAPAAGVKEEGPCENNPSWGHSSVVGHELRMCKALPLILSTRCCGESSCGDLSTRHKHSRGTSTQRPLLERQSRRLPAGASCPESFPDHLREGDRNWIVCDRDHHRKPHLSRCREQLTGGGGQIVEPEGQGTRMCLLE